MFCLIVSSVIITPDLIKVIATCSNVFAVKGLGNKTKQVFICFSPFSDTLCRTPLSTRTNNDHMT